MDQLPFTLDTIEAFFLMFVRVAAILSLFPIFSSTVIPVPAKVGLALFLTGALFAAVPSARHLALPADLPVAMLIFLIVKEAAVGLAIGFAATFLFTAVNFAARLIDVEMGFGMVDLIDPFSEEAITTMGQLWIIVFTIILLLINGHYFFLLSIHKSFELFPVLGGHLEFNRLAAQFSHMVGDVFVIALRMSAPVYVALILTQMALGIVARTVPQINIFFVGLPIQILIGIGMTIVAFPLLAGLFRKILEGIIKDIWSILYIMA